MKILSFAGFGKIEKGEIVFSSMSAQSKTVTIVEVEIAQDSEVGVNIYILVSVLLTVDGNQVPEIEFVEIVSNVGTVAPEQMEGILLNVGVTFGVIETTAVVVVAQEPEEGVKMYVPSNVLLTTEGDQVPVTELVETDGSTGEVAPEQIEETIENVGDKGVGTTFTVILKDKAHCPEVGENT